MFAGFSLGEVATAGFIGIVSFDQAFHFVMFCAECMELCAEKVHGAMGAVPRLRPKEVEEVCHKFTDQASPANYNCSGRIPCRSDGRKDPQGADPKDIARCKVL